MVNEEKKRILDMVASGKISSEEGLKLMEAIEDGPGEESRFEGKKRFLKVRVVDLTSGKTQVNLSIPSGLIKFGINMAKKFSPEMQDADIDWEAIHETIRSNSEGKIIDIEDEKENKKVEIWME